MSRPEHIAPPDVYYDQAEAQKYLVNSRMIKIQTQLAERCLELLNFPDDKPKFLLDIGCGTGLSGDVLAEHGHAWVGLDISRPMLEVALERDVEGDLFQKDIGEGMFFRTGVFDGAISVSALQWLCNAETSDSKPHRRLHIFFESLYTCLRRGSRAVLQMYPETPAQMDLLVSAAMKAGFSGGLVVDFPHSTRAKKYYLVITAGVANKGPTGTPMAALTNTPHAGSSQQNVTEHTVRRERPKSKNARKREMQLTLKEKIIQKKERQRRQGREVRPDSKYTGRRRSKKF